MRVRLRRKEQAMLLTHDVQESRVFFYTSTKGDGIDEHTDRMLGLLAKSLPTRIDDAEDDVVHTLRLHQDDREQCLMESVRRYSQLGRRLVDSSREFRGETLGHFLDVTPIADLCSGADRKVTLHRQPGEVFLPKSTCPRLRQFLETIQVDGEIIIDRDLLLPPSKPRVRVE